MLHFAPIPKLNSTVILASVPIEHYCGDGSVLPHGKLEEVMGAYEAASGPLRASNVLAINRSTISVAAFVEGKKYDFHHCMSERTCISHRPSDLEVHVNHYLMQQHQLGEKAFIVVPVGTYDHHERDVAIQHPLQISSKVRDIVAQSAGTLVEWAYPRR